MKNHLNDILHLRIFRIYILNFILRLASATFEKIFKKMAHFDNVFKQKMQKYNFCLLNTVRNTASKL